MLRIWYILAILLKIGVVGETPAVVTAYEDLQGLEGQDFSSYEDLEVESCPHIGLEDAQRSACVTRIFREYLLPRLRKGMPKFGVHPIEPYLKDVLNFTVINIGILHWSCTVRDLVVTGFGNLSRADIVYDTPGRSLTLNLEFPRIVGHSARTTVDGHMFGIPTRYFTQEGSIVFYIDGFTLVAKFLITPKRAEFFKLLNVYTEFRDVLGQQKGLAKPAWVEEWMNWFSRRYRRQLFQYVVKQTFIDLFTSIFTTWMEPNTWREIIGEVEE